MRPLSRYSRSAAGLVEWLLRLATSLLARALDMPAPLVHSTGIFVFAQVQAVESSVGRTLCLMHLARQLLALCRRICRR